MKVLIYGGSGFLGRNLANYLNKKKHKVTVFDKKKIYFDKKNIKFIKGDILNLSQVQKATKGQDIVYNLAGISDIGDSIKNPISTTRINILGSVFTLEAAVKYRVKRYIFASSIYALSEQGGFYSSTKLSSEIFIKRYSKKYNLEYNILRFGSIFGENANTFNTINQIINNYRKRNKILRNTDGNEIRNYIHVTDAAKICHQIMINKNNINKTFNIIGSKSYKVKKLLNEVGKKLDKEVVFSKNKITRSDHYKINPYSLKITKGKMIKPKNAIDIKEWLISNLS